LSSKVDLDAEAKRRALFLVEYYKVLTLLYRIPGGIPSQNI